MVGGEDQLKREVLRYQSSDVGRHETTNGAIRSTNGRFHGSSQRKTDLNERRPPRDNERCHQIDERTSPISGRLLAAATRCSDERCHRQDEGRDRGHCRCNERSTSVFIFTTKREASMRTGQRQFFFLLLSDKRENERDQKRQV